MIQVALNQAYDKQTIDLLLMLSKVGKLWISSDGLLTLSAPVASGLVDAVFEVRVTTKGFAYGGRIAQDSVEGFAVCLSTRGTTLVEAWLAGRQGLAIGS